jgi:hypothetical protein
MITISVLLLFAKSLARARRPPSRPVHPGQHDRSGGAVPSQERRGLAVGGTPADPLARTAADRGLSGLAQSCRELSAGPVWFNHYLNQPTRAFAALTTNPTAESTI